MNIYIPMLTLCTLGSIPFLVTLLAFIENNGNDIILGGLSLLSLGIVLVALHYVDYPPICVPISILMVFVFFSLVVWVKYDSHLPKSNTRTLLKNNVVRFYGALSLLFIIPNLYILVNYRC